MPSAYEGTDIISYLQRKYIIRQRRISYRVSDISLKSTELYGMIVKKEGKRLPFLVSVPGRTNQMRRGETPLPRNGRRASLCVALITVNRINICGTLGNGGEYAVLGEMCFTKSYRLE